MHEQIVKDGIVADFGFSLLKRKDQAVEIFTVKLLTI